MTAVGKCDIHGMSCVVGGGEMYLKGKLVNVPDSHYEIFQHPQFISMSGQ